MASHCHLSEFALWWSVSQIFVILWVVSLLLRCSRARRTCERVRNHLLRGNATRVSGVHTQQSTFSRVCVFFSFDYLLADGGNACSLDLCISKFLKTFFTLRGLTRHLLFSGQGLDPGHPAVHDLVPSLFASTVLGLVPDLPGGGVIRALAVGPSLQDDEGRVLDVIVFRKSLTIEYFVKDHWRDPKTSSLIGSVK